MSVFKKLLFSLTLLALCLALSCAQAATAVKDGLTVTLSADKAACSEGDQLRLSLSLESDGSVQIISPTVTFEYPDVLVPLWGSSVLPDEIRLTPGTPAVLSASFTAVPDPAKADGADALPVTGDDSHLTLWLLLLALCAAGALRLGRRQRRQLLALILCLAAAGSMTGVCAVRAEETEGVIRVTETVRVMGEDVEITAVVRYGIAAADSASGGDTKKDAAKHSLYSYEGFNLYDTMTTSTELVYDQAYTTVSALPQSAHNYEHGADQLYLLGSYGASRVTITFSEACRVETGYDLLLVYDGDGNYVAGYTGSEMAGKKVSVLGSCLFIRLLSDFSYSDYGFSLTAFSDIGAPEVTCSQTGDGYVRVQWNKQSSAITGYRVQRAEIREDGSVGDYTTLKASTTVVTSYTDKTAKTGRHYSYRVRQTFKYGGQKYTTDYGSTDILVMGVPSITGGKMTTVNGAPAVTLTWKALSLANYYDIHRSTSKDGPYTCIGSTYGETSYTDVLPDNQIYYYKIQPFRLENGAVYTGSASAPVPFGFMDTPTGLSAYSTTSSRITLSWDETPNATGYLIYRSSSMNGTYTRVGKTSSTKLANIYAPAKRLSYFKVRSYNNESGDTITSDYSDPIAIHPLAKPAGLTGKRLSNTSVSLSWDKVARADSYEVFLSYSKNGTYKSVGTFTTNSCTISGLGEDYMYAYFKVRAKRTSGIHLSKSAYSSVVKVKKDPQTLRALYIVEQDFPGSSYDRYNCYLNATRKLESIFSRATPYGKKITTQYQYRDQSRSQILKRISTMADLADNNDVTVFYLGSHGSSDGYVWLSDDSYLSLSALASALRKIPGKVVVILDHCHSGLAIGKGAQPGGEDGKTFGELAIEAFASEDTTIAYADNNDTDGACTDAAMTVSGKFYVITSARGSESSWRNDSEGTYLMQWIDDGVMSADEDGNGTVTLGEIEDYLYDRGWDKSFWSSSEGRYVRMIPQVYPSGSAFPIFRE